MLHDPAASKGGNSHHEEIFRDVSAGLGEQAVTTGIHRCSLLFLFSQLYKIGSCRVFCCCGASVVSEQRHNNNNNFNDPSFTEKYNGFAV